MSAPYHRPNSGQRQRHANSSMRIPPYRRTGDMLPFSVSLAVQAGNYSGWRPGQIWSASRVSHSKSMADVTLSSKVRRAFHIGLQYRSSWTVDLGHYLVSYLVHMSFPGSLPVSSEDLFAQTSFYQTKRDMLSYAVVCHRFYTKSTYNHRDSHSAKLTS